MKKILKKRTFYTGYN